MTSFDLSATVEPHTTHSVDINAQQKKNPHYMAAKTFKELQCFQDDAEPSMILTDSYTNTHNMDYYTQLIQIWIIYSSIKSG